jgi:hypothetical protein
LHAYFGRTKRRTNRVVELLRHLAPDLGHGCVAARAAAIVLVEVHEDLGARQVFG